MGCKVEIIVRQDSIDNLLVVTTFAHPLGGDLGMFPQIGIFLVIAVVQQPSHSPEFFVFAIFASIETQGNFNREHMLLKILIFYMPRHELVGIITCWHNSYSLCP